MTRTYDFTWIKKNSLVQYMKDPHAMSWLNEYKAKRLAEQNELVTVGMARHAVKKGCKYFIKVKKEYAQDARKQLIGDDEVIFPDGIVFYSDGKIFLRDEEKYTMLKMLYT